MHVLLISKNDVRIFIDLDTIGFKSYGIKI